MSSEKYLTDSEILKWNDRISKSNINLVPRFNTRNGYPDISINSIDNYHGIGTRIQETSDPYIVYDFSFSVIENRKDEFFILFKKIYNDKFGTKIIFNDNHISINIYREEDIIKSEVRHKVLNRDFIKYTYKFKGKLSSIIAYISYLEDAISFFQLIWGYDEEGNEICLTKYKVGDIVSLKNDKSKDYLIIDYLYSRFNNNYRIQYYISEMISEATSIIRYGDILQVSEHEITWSRDSRINDLLN